MFSKKIWLGVFMVITSIYFLFLNGCSHEPLNPNNNKNDSLVFETNCDPDTVYFQNEILPMLQSTCALSGCHNSASHREGVVLETYSDIMHYVTPGKPNASNLYFSIRYDMPPSKDDRLDSDQRKLIADWIDQGALNNKCESGCDTSNYTFIDQIQPILNKYCIGCHGNSGGEKGVILVGYDNVILEVDNGKLENAIQGKNGVQLMPPGNSMPTCEIDLIKNWIKHGAKND